MLTERLGLKATALFITVLLWFMVGARQPTESYVNVRLEPELDSTLVLLDRPPPLRALVTGRAADIVKLYASPPVLRRTIGGEAPDTLVLDVSPADVHLPPEVASDVRVLDVQPRNVTLRFGASATRRVVVLNAGRIHLEGDTSRQSGVRVRFEPETVRITGPRRTVRRLRGVHPSALSISVGDTMPHVADLDTAGLGVRVHPAQVKVQVRDTATVPPAIASP
jgi:hypothetical protein